MKTEVIKRDGTIEKYDEGHVTKVAVACGLKPEEAQALAESVTIWIKDNSLSKVTSLQIRDIFLEDLKKINKSAADLFLWYEETKNN
ncbi:MAG TPA: ATP cone domain-containing protein [Patescibacteria group bacterium]|nr:ATP cone domain-containing protein [Patescibacteria group bacterium]